MKTELSGMESPANGDAAPPPADAPAVQETLAEKLGTVPPAAPAPADKEASVFYQFVIFPLLIVGITVGIFGLFRWLASEDRAHYTDYLSDIQSRWEQRRDEAAYQLEYRIADESDPLRKEADPTKTLFVFQALGADKTPGAIKARAHLAIVLGHLRAGGEVVPALIDAATAAPPDDPSEAVRNAAMGLRLNSIWALGRIKDARAVPVLTGLLEDPFDGVRKIAAGALGDLGDRSAADKLVKRLQTPGEEIDVRWNAALALALLKDDRALPTLLSMVDRKLLESVQGKRDQDHTPMTDAQRREVMTAALRGIYQLGATSALDKVSALADGDPDLRVREAAMEVRDALKAKQAAR